MYTLTTAREDHISTTLMIYDANNELIGTITVRTDHIGTTRDLLTATLPSRKPFKRTHEELIKALAK